MRAYEVVVEMHEEYGSLGLKLADRHWADPFPAMALAHDILEHGANDKGSTEEELIALGASLYVRDHGSYFAQKGQYRTSPGENISGDLVEQISYMLNRGESLSLRSPGRTTRCEDHIEDKFDIAIRESVKEARERFSDPEDFPDLFKKNELWKIRGWLRRGYRSAIKRYRGRASAGDLCWLFMQIEKEGERVLKYGDEGMRFKFFVDVTHGRVRVDEMRDPYDY